MFRGSPSVAQAQVAGDEAPVRDRRRRPEGRSRGKALGLGLAFAGLALGSASTAADSLATLLQNFGAGVLSGEPAPVALPDLGGQLVTLESQRGRVTMLYFWATW
jgi:hypothetical protein